jgi:hypothetical protein
MNRINDGRVISFTSGGIGAGNVQTDGYGESIGYNKWLSKILQMLQLGKMVQELEVERQELTFIHLQCDVFKH